MEKATGSQQGGLQSAWDANASQAFTKSGSEGWNVSKVTFASAPAHSENLLIRVEGRANQDISFRVIDVTFKYGIITVLHELVEDNRSFKAGESINFEYSHIIAADLPVGSITAKMSFEDANGESSSIVFKFNVGP